jgi:hypothetical protein
MSKNSPEQMLQSMIDNLPEKTGKPMKEWLKVVAKSGKQKHGEIVKQRKIEGLAQESVRRCLSCITKGHAKARPQ